MRRVSAFAVAFLAAVLLPSFAFAQANLSGVVKDTSGAVLPGVTVEAASPVLIEKVRTTVSDGNGRYQITELRPGTYTVTFTLPGFNTVKRDGVVLSGSGATTVDVELRVGALTETITVTGEAPVVDTKTITKQQVLNSENINALPTARNYFGLARMIPGTAGGGNDVGGSNIQQVGQSVTVHGSRNTDQRVTANGVNTMTLQAGGNIGGQTPDVGSASEVTVDTTSLSADLPTGGIRVNFIPRDGGNKFANNTFFTFTKDALQGNNYTSELKAAGLGTPNKVKYNYDINESLGGPIMKDKVWFWFSTRYNRVQSQAPIANNLNAFNPNAWTYVADPAHPGITEGKQFNNGLRVTWQVTPKVKVAGTYKPDRWCACPNAISATLAPEAAREFRFPRLRQEHFEITSPVTNRLLLEGVALHLFERWGNMHLRPAAGGITDAQAAVYPQMISVLEQSNNLRYRSNNVYNNTRVPDWTYRVAASYVTGSHAVKVGMNNTSGSLNEYNYVLQNTSYRFNGGVPNLITQYAYPFRNVTNLDRDLGLYVQDKWTATSKLTVNGAIRFDNFKSSFPAQTMGSTVFTPTRNITFPEQDNINWKDMSYRTGAAFDLFGNGKTAIKVAANKYLLGQTLNGLGRDANPSLALANSTDRVWTDNGDYIPQCNLFNPAANGECGAILNGSFGSTVPAATFDPLLMSGWNHRQSNWEFSASVQHELVRGVAVDVGYFRRIWENFRVTDNLNLAAADFTQFSMVVPTNANLPNSGQTITGLFNVVPAKATAPVANFNTLDRKFGNQYEHWNGLDASVNARLQNGLTLQAGVSSGKKYENNCDIVQKLPEMLQLSAGDAADTPNAPGNQWRPLQYCNRTEPMQTQFKSYGVYTLPKIDVQVSGTFRSVPGTSLSAAFTATNAYLGANSTLGRPIAGGSNISINVLPPLNKYTERRNELDMRFGKVLRFAGARSVVSLDVFNFLNSPAIVNQSQAFSTFLVPTEILNPRIAKISATFEF